jgi:DnaK suppressor protein
MASRKRTTVKAGKRAVVMGKSKPNGKPLNGRHVKHANGKSNGTAGTLAALVPKARKDQLKSKAPPTAKRGDTVKSQIVLPVGYRPADDEPFMNERQRIYFRKKLLTWRDEIIRQTRETLQGLHEDSSQHADIADRATFETDRALELRARDRQRKLISKIDSALARIEDGSYGYCEETGEPISLKRLDARPIATLSLEAQERHERRERVFRED